MRVYNTLTRQKEENRLVCHLLYAVTKVRGKDTQIIEDLIPILDTEVEINIPAKPNRVYLAVQDREIPFKYSNGTLRFTLDRFECHAMIVIE